MPSYYDEPENVHISTANCELILQVMEEYATKTRIDVESIFTNADGWLRSKMNREMLLTKLKMNRDILISYRKAMDVFRTQADLPELITFQNPKLVDVPNIFVDFDTALPTLHKVYVLLIQLSHIIPLLENEKTIDEMTVFSKTDDKEIDITLRKDVAEKLSTKEDNEVEKMNNGEKELGSKLSSGNIEEKQNESVNSTKVEKEKIKKIWDDTDEEDDEVDTDDEEQEELPIVTKEMTNLRVTHDSSIEPNVLKLSQILCTKSFENLSLYSNFVQLFNEDRSEGTFIYIVDKISCVSDHVTSPKCVIRNLSWKVSCINRKEEKNHQLGVFVSCSDEKHSLWSCSTKVYLVLLSQKDGVKNISRDFVHSYSTNADSLGYQKFIDWDTLVNPSAGYIKNDKIILQVIVKPEEPQFVSQS